MVPVSLTSTATPTATSAPTVAITVDNLNPQAHTREAVMKQLYSFLLSQVCKGGLQTNKVISGDRSLSLAGNTALEESFWEQVITTVVQQSQYYSVRVQGGDGREPE